MEQIHPINKDHSNVENKPSNLTTDNETKSQSKLESATNQDLIHKKFHKLKLYNKINIFNLLTIVEKVDYFFSNKKLLHYLLPRFNRKSILIFQDILKKDPYSCGIKLKKIFQYYYENKNYSNCDIFSAIFLYIKHLNETHSEVTLDFPMFDNEDYFHTSSFPLRYFPKDALNLIEEDFDKKFESAYCENGSKKIKFKNVNEIFADIIDPKKTVLNITDNSAVDKYLYLKVYRINLLYFSKRGHSWSHFFNFSPQHLIFPKSEAFYENLFLGDNVLDFDKNSYFRKFKNKVKNLSFEIYAEYNLAHYNEGVLPHNYANNYETGNAENLDEDINMDKSYRFFQLDNFIKNNLESIETIKIHVNNSLVTFFHGVLRSLIEMFKAEKFLSLQKIMIAKYYSNNKNLNESFTQLLKREIVEEKIDYLLEKIENGLFSNGNNLSYGILENGNEFKLNLSSVQIAQTSIDPQTHRNELCSPINFGDELNCLHVYFDKNDLPQLIAFLSEIENEKLSKIWLNVNNRDEVKDDDLFVSLKRLIMRNKNLRKIKIESSYLLEFKIKNTVNETNKVKISSVIFRSIEKDFYFSQLLNKLKLIDNDIDDNLETLTLYGKLFIFPKDAKVEENLIHFKNLEKIYIENLSTFEFFKNLSYFKTDNLKYLIFEEPHKKYFEQTKQYIEFDEINDEYIDYLNHLKKFSYMIIDSKYDDIGNSVLNSHLFFDKKLKFTILKTRMNKGKSCFHF